MTTKLCAWRRWSGVAAAAALLAAWTAAGAAELDFEPYAASQYLYDSNVYRFSNQVAEVTGTADAADRSLRNTAGIGAGYRWQQQHLQVTAEARQFKFDVFDHLDHGEHMLAAAFDGRLRGGTRASLDFRDERRMASFEDRRTTQLVMERDLAARAGVAVAVTPQWQVTAGVRGRRLYSPLPDAPALPQPAPGAPARVASPDFAVHEAGLSAGVQYGIENKEHPEDEAPLLVGVLLEHTQVDFTGFTPQPQPPPGVTRETFEGYSLIALGATAAYSLDGMSSLDGELGITQYRPAGSGDTSLSATGEISYVRRPSVITELKASLYRRIVPIAPTASAGSETGIGLGVRWEFLRRIEVQAGYAFATSTARSESLFAPENSGRDDRVQRASFSVAYPRQQTLVIRAFATYDDRRSSLGFNDYRDVTVGAELTARWGAEPATE